jgi:hypothetical protein
MKLFSLIIPVFLLMEALTYSQTGDSKRYPDEIFKRLSQKHSGSGDISVYQDARLEEVLSEYISINQQKNGIPAYWIRIYSGSGHDAREKAYQTKAKFLSKYEGIKDKVVYDDPNFKVYIGGYRIKSEALKLLKTIQRDFPSAFIVYDIIDFPDL